MIFQKSTPKQQYVEPELETEEVVEESSEDNVETVVGPSVNVEGDFASEGNIIVKGTVAGSVHTSRHLTVEPGAKIAANVRANSAQIAGEVRGNIKVRESLEMLSSARVVGDIEAKTIAMETGALLLGKVVMPGLEEQKTRSSRSSSRKTIVEDITVAEGNL